MTLLSTGPPGTQTVRRPELALGALALGAFGIGLTEFVIVGLLGVLGDDLSIAVPAAGLLVSGYAAGVAVGAPLMTALSARVPRKTMLVSLMGIFILGNLLSALAPNYELLLVGRIVAALTHGAFFGIGSVVAAGLVAPDRHASAIGSRRGQLPNTAGRSRVRHQGLEPRTR